jgi:hypothetical protein
MWRLWRDAMLLLLCCEIFEMHTHTHTYRSSSQTQPTQQPTKKNTAHTEDEERRGEERESRVTQYFSWGKGEKSSGKGTIYLFCLNKNILDFI